MQVQSKLGIIQDISVRVLKRKAKSDSHPVYYVEVQSQSRVGLKDYGENNRNIDRLLNYLNKAMPAKWFYSIITGSFKYNK